MIEASAALPRRPASAHAPVRTCVGCGKRADGRELLTIVRGELAPTVHLAGSRLRGPGRGARVHATRACLERAERGLSRAFKRETRAQAGALLHGAVEALAARRAELLAGVAPGHGRYVVVATDAPASTLHDVAGHVARGEAVACGTQQELGAPSGVAHMRSAAELAALRHVVERLRALSEGLA